MPWRETNPSVTARLAARFTHVRRFTEALARPLSPEDCGLQSMPDASPTKWHMAHTTWFFEALVLGAGGGRAAVRSRLRVPVQLVLRGHRPQARPSASRPALASLPPRGHRLSRLGR